MHVHMHLCAHTHMHIYTRSQNHHKVCTNLTATRESETQLTDLNWKYINTGQRHAKKKYKITGKHGYEHSRRSAENLKWRLAVSFTVTQMAQKSRLIKTSTCHNNINIPHFCCCCCFSSLFFTLYCNRLRPHGSSQLQPSEQVLQNVHTEINVSFQNLDNLHRFWCCLQTQNANILSI